MLYYFIQTLKFITGINTSSYFAKGKELFPCFYEEDLL